MSGVKAAAVTAAAYTVLPDDRTLIVNRAGVVTLTLLPPAAWAGHDLRVITAQAQAVVSAASNVAQPGAAAGTAILPATAGSWADLRSDGTSWVVVGRGVV